MVADANRRGYQHLLEGFWDEGRAHGLDLPTEAPVSAASFCEARRKITPALLRHLLHEIAATYLASASNPQRWHGRRVFAVDGTKINLQRSPDLEVAFGVPASGYCPQVLVSIMLDVCAKAPVDVEVSPFASCEREHLLNMLPSLERGDVLVLDRGYPSHDVLQALVRNEVDFLVRVPSSHTFRVIDEFRESGRDDATFELEPPEGSPPDWETIRVRAVRLHNADGDESFYLTTLSRAEFSRASIRELYHLRWEAEEFFKLLKSDYIGQGQFRSKTPSGVKQEIHALVLFLAIARVLMAAAAETTGSEYTSMSQKAAVLALAAHLTRLFLAPNHEIAKTELEALLRRIARSPRKRRHGRASPRVSLRPRPRWGPSGRIGA